MEKKEMMMVLILVMSFMAPVTAQTTYNLQLDGGIYANGEYTSEIDVGQELNLGNGNVLLVTNVYSNSYRKVAQISLSDQVGTEKKLEVDTLTPWVIKLGNYIYTISVIKFDDSNKVVLGYSIRPAANTQTEPSTTQPSSPAPVTPSEPTQTSSTQAAVCSDSDPEDSPYQKSELVSTDTSLFWHGYKDYCIDKKTLVEMQCYMGSHAYKQWYAYKLVNCEERGEVCQEGVCVKPSTEAAPSTSARATILVVYTDDQGRPMKNVPFTLHYSESGKDGDSAKTNEYGEAKFEVEEGKIFYIKSAGQAYSIKYRLYGNARLCELTSGEVCDDKLVIKITHVTGEPKPETGNESVSEPEPLPDTGRDAYTLAVAKGWNLVSVPLDGAKVESSGCENAKIFTYDTSSNRFSRAKPESFSPRKMESFWVKAKDDCKMNFVGTSFTDDDVDDVSLGKGWNFIGAPARTVDYTDVEGTCETRSGPWEFNNKERKWERTNDLVPGKGHILKVGSACELGAAIPAIPNE